MASLGAAPLLLATTSLAPAGDLAEALAAADAERVVRVLLAPDFHADGADARALAGAPEPLLAAVAALVANQQPPREPELDLLRGAHAAVTGQPGRAASLLRPLLRTPRLALLATQPAGQSATQLCRAGNDEGLGVLEDLVEVYRGAPWAFANLGLGLRLLGRYDEAFRAYREALAVAGRRAWILNDLGLLRQATGDRSGALALFLEGSADAADAGGQDTCRTNAALLLLARNDVGDVRAARELLSTAVQRDPTRVRARYWLAQVLRMEKLEAGR